LRTKKKIIIGLIEGIEYIHSKDFIHRDIKPSNILMKKVDNNSNEFIPKIGDFGQGISLHNFI
jgi:serine/threonine protein kinase